MTVSSRFISWLGLGLLCRLEYMRSRTQTRHARSLQTYLARETNSTCVRLEYVIILNSRRQTRLALAFGHVWDSSRREIGTLGNSGFIDETSRLDEPDSSWQLDCVGLAESKASAIFGYTRRVRSDESDSSSCRTRVDSTSQLKSTHRYPVNGLTIFIQVTLINYIHTAHCPWENLQIF